VDRREMKKTLASLLALLMKKQIDQAA